MNAGPSPHIITKRKWSESNNSPGLKISENIEESQRREPADTSCMKAVKAHWKQMVPESLLNIYIDSKTAEFVTNNQEVKLESLQFVNVLSLHVMVLVSFHHPAVILHGHAASSRVAQTHQARHHR